MSEIFVTENIFQIINVLDDVIWTIFPDLYPYWAINSKKRKYSLLVSQFFYIDSTKPFSRDTTSHLSRALSR